MVTIVPCGLIFHMRSQGMVTGGQFRLGVIVLMGWLLVLTCLFTFVPLILGLRSLENRDY